MIEVKSIIKKYPGKVAVNDVSFKIGKREIVGLLGANGAGKSTIMNIITGYTAMTSGSVWVNGLDLIEEPIKVRKKIGYLPEHTPLYGDMTVEEYLKFVYELKNSKRKPKDEIHNVCKMMSILDVKKRLIKHLSKGYRQRVGFAQALLGNPEIIILDEPTVGLDPNQIIEFRKIIQKLREEHTIIMSTHILSEVQILCQRVLVMDNGKLVADGKTNSLFEQMTGIERIKLCVSGKSNQVTSVLKELDGIKRIEPLNVTKTGEVEFAVFINNKENVVNIKKEITKNLSEKQMYVTEMKRDSINLEDVFNELTKNNEQEVDNEGTMETEFYGIH